GLKRVTLELGSNSALYVDESMDSKIDDVIDRAVTGAFSYNGQVCIHTQRIYVHRNIAAKFSTKFVEKTKTLQYGDPLNEETIITGMINKKEQERVLKWVEEAIQGGAKLLTGGEKKDSGILPTV